MSSYKMRDIASRFMDKVEPLPWSGCWIWVMPLSVAGYGRFQHGHIRTQAHRVSYEIHRGPIPIGLQIDHLCRVRCCVNPDHLEAVTGLENVRRGMAGEINKGKTHCPQGHAYTNENTYVPPCNQSRYCLECMRGRTIKKNEESRIKRIESKKRRVL